MITLTTIPTLLMALSPGAVSSAAASFEPAVAAQDSGRIAIVAGELHTAAGPVIRDGVVLIDNGRITAVGSASEISIPEGWSVRKAAVATPGLVDAHTSVGLAGWLNIDHDRDELDRSEAMQPELRAIDAYNLDDPLVAWVRSYGVTTVHTGHAPGALVPGQTMVAKTVGPEVADAVLVSEAMISAVLSDRARGSKGPGTRAKSAALLRAALHSATEFARKQEAHDAGDGDAPDRDLRKEAFARVIRGQTPLLVTAHEAHDILTALRIAQEFPTMRLVLDGAAEAPRVIDSILAAKVPVILHPQMQRASGEAKELSFETARILNEAGVPIALQSGYESYVPRARVLLFEAAIAARYGLDRLRALDMVTIDAARICGVDDRVGSLEVGKDGDVALFDGDPFEYTTHCVGTVIEGRVVSEREQWQAR
ncbi:MAG: imidazolonepropionase-like amidohydrolase [Planctomycetota bacterium]|jgi:imidazolonepropionase-like amidohydrolase